MRGRTGFVLGVIVTAGAFGLWQVRPAPVPAVEVAVVPTPEAPARKKKRPPAAVGGGLVRPEPKPCLAAPEVEGEGMAASTGLGQADARTALNGFAPELVSCLAPDESPTGALLLRITVACTGLVDHVEVADRADWTPTTAACVAERLAFAPFPAHDLPDGDVVDWPLRYTPP